MEGDRRTVLFVTTKNLDYIRNVQELRLLRERGCHVTVAGSCAARYPRRLLTVWLWLLRHPLDEFDTVFLGFSPQLIWAMAAGRLRRWRSKDGARRLWIDCFISVYDTLCLDRKKVRPGSAAGRALHRLDEAALRGADGIVCDTAAHGRYLAREFGVDPARFSVLYLEADRRIYYPRPQNKRPEARGRFVVLYFGSMLPLQGADVVEAAARLLKDRDDLYFYLIGGRRARTEGNLSFVPWLPQEALAEAIAGADLCLAGHFCASIEKASRTVPGKAYIYDAMEKKMILGDNPANREVFPEGGRVRYVRMGSAGALAREIVRCREEAQV